jgi:hypothetical protein
MRAPAFVSLFSLMALTLLPLSGQAQVYSWKDANGKVHYGDRPPVEQQAQSRKVQGAPVATDDVEAARKATVERQFKEREQQGKAEEGTKKPPEDPAAAKQRQENCRTAKNNLASIESGVTRFRINEKGEREALEGSTRQAELAQARKAVKEWCSPPAAK